ncbi:MAG TPA: DinB family protein [Micromonosporaceae bacterium]|nr:DinB family protein [Micromonosporaceae bacterium]
MTAGPIERHWPKQWADEELTLQLEFLTFLRITAVNKIAELDPALAAAAPIKTSPVMTLLGVIKHLTAVEREWFTRVGGGSDLPSLWEDDPEFDWRIRPEDTPASVVAAYREEWANAEAALAGKTADDRAVVTVNGRDRTVCWLLSWPMGPAANNP